MLLSVMLAAASFAYSVARDPIDDSETHIVRATNSGGASISVECGPGTLGKPAVIVDAGRPLWRSPVGNMADYRERVRFDQDVPGEARFIYNQGVAYLVDRHAIGFIQQMKTHSSVSLEVTDNRNQKLMLTVNLAGARESLDEFGRHCPA